MRGNLDTSNASVVLLQTELDSRKDELERYKQKHKDQAASQQKELLLCKQELKAQTMISKHQFVCLVLRRKKKINETKSVHFDCEVSIHFSIKVSMVYVHIQ